MRVAGQSKANRLNRKSELKRMNGESTSYGIEEELQTWKCLQKPGLLSELAHLRTLQRLVEHEPLVAEDTSDDRAHARL